MAIYRIDKSLPSRSPLSRAPGFQAGDCGRRTPLDEPFSESRLVGMSGFVGGVSDADTALTNAYNFTPTPRARSTSAG